MSSLNLAETLKSMYDENQYNVPQVRFLFWDERNGWDRMRR